MREWIEKAAAFIGCLPGDDSSIHDLLGRLRSTGVVTLVLTVDVPIASNRDKDRRLGFSVPIRPTLPMMLDAMCHPRWLFGTFAKTILTQGIPKLPNFTGQPIGRSLIAKPNPQARASRDRFTWEHAKLIRRAWNGRMIIKGILSPDDARRAVQLGADGLIVSNHGGRQLDGAVAPLDMLPEIVEVSGTVPVMIDGGIRRGTDALKALELGAQMVFLGRPMLYAAVTDGQCGVEQAIQILRSEIATSLALLGCNNLEQLDQSHLSKL